MSKDKLFLIDAHAICYRSFYAIKELKTSNGQSTNAVYGFISTLRKIIRDYKPEFLAVCFDSKEKTHRQKKFSEYKIHRPKMPDELISQMPIIKQVVTAYNLASFEFGGYEADDIIATLTNQVSAKNIDVVIVSEDKDMYQLVNSNVTFLSTKNNAFLDHDKVKQKLGFEPAQIIDYIGLAGDKVDNIPGVQGIGDVTAKKLINEFGSIEDIFNNIDDVKPAKVQEKLNAQKDAAVLSKELAILDLDVPIEYSLDDMKVIDPQKKELFQLFKDLEFKRLAQEYAQKSVSTVSSVQLIDQKEEAKTLCERIRKSKKFAFNISEDHYLFVALDDSLVYKLPLNKSLNSLNEVLSDDSIVKIVHDFKKCLKTLSDWGKPTISNVFDVMLVAYLVGGSGGYSISDIAWKNLQISLEEDCGPEHRVIVISQLFSVLDKQLKSEGLESLYKNIEIPLSYVLAKMERDGVKLDTELLKELSNLCGQKINELSKEIFEIARYEFNINSPKQLSKVLFEELKLPVIKKTKTGYSTNESVLRTLASNHAFPALIIEYRQYAKLKSTYIDALPKMVDIRSGRIHAHFNQVGAETGRLSSDHPNLQNIPIRTELGRKIRRAFIPSEKNLILVSADYSQIELRILAHLSKDEALIDAFKKDQDIHVHTASLIFDIDENDVAKKMRDVAKRVNFGIVYGMSAFGLAKDLEISNAEAQTFIDKYFLRYPKVRSYMDDCIKICEKQGFVTTLLKRRRYIQDINSNNPAIKQFADRQAINAPVQGSAADYMKSAMVNLGQKIEENKFKSKMLITVHDELVFEIYKDEEDTLIEIIRNEMENPIALDVPIKVSVKKGQNWLDMKEVEQS